MPRPVLGPIAVLRGELMTEESEKSYRKHERKVSSKDLYTEDSVVEDSDYSEYEDETTACVQIDSNEVLVGKPGEYVTPGGTFYTTLTTTFIDGVFLL